MVPFISVIIPIYNGERYLERCLDSILSQDYYEIEIICVNDGSTDKTGLILSNYQKKDERLVILTQNNLGLGSARNAGLQCAKGNWVTFVDSDDYLCQGAYSSLVKLGNEYDIIVYGTRVIGHINKTDIDRVQQYYDLPTSGKVILDDNLRLTTNVSVWNKLFKKSIIQKNGVRFPEGLIFEDYSFYWQYITKCKIAYYLNQQFYAYYQHENSIMFYCFNEGNSSGNHLLVLDDTFFQLRKTGDYEGHPVRNYQMFCYCF